MCVYFLEFILSVYQLMAIKAVYKISSTTTLKVCQMEADVAIVEWLHIM